MVKKIALISISLIVLLGLSNCGGNASRAPVSSGEAQVQMFIEWPSSRHIPPETKQIRVTVSGEGLNEPIVKDFDRPMADGSKKTLVTFVTIPVPAGPERVFSVTAHSVASGDVAIACGNAVTSLTPGEAKNLTIKLEATPSWPKGHQLVEPESEGIRYGIQRVIQPDKKWGQIILTLSNPSRSNLSSLRREDFVIRQRTAGTFVDSYPVDFENLSTTVRKIDIAFVLDTTGSMGGEIAGVRDSVRAFAEELRGAGLDLRLAAVTFGDVVNDPDGSLDPGGVPRPVLDLTSKVDDFKDFVGSLSASGGGDNPEVSLDAIHFAATNLSWRSDAHKVIIVITDATSHQRGDGTDFASVTAEEVIRDLQGRFTVYVVSPVDPVRSRSNEQGGQNLQRHSGRFGQVTRGREYTQPYDVKNLAPQLGGVWLELPRSGSVNLNELGITGFLINTYRFKYPLHVINYNHYILVVVRLDTAADGKWVKFFLEVR